MSVMLERPDTVTSLQLLALDITRNCQMHCTHCYNNSGPQGTDGEMTRADWLSVLDQAAALGVVHVQLIGGEPTLHPDLSALIVRALGHGMGVEIFTNLAHVRDALWPVFQTPGVTLATSYYSDQAREHEAITQRPGSYARTKANIARAVEYGIAVRGEVIQRAPGQRVHHAAAELVDLGVTGVKITQVRGIGRGADAGGTHDISQLCGLCAHGRAAIMPGGDVTACVMSGEMMAAGNVRTAPLAQILTSPEWASMAALIPRAKADMCPPDVGPCGAACPPDLTGPCGAAHHAPGPGTGN